MLNTSGLESKL